MTAEIIPFPIARVATRRDAEAAWERYAAHRAPEIDDPGLADDPAHKAEGVRLHRLFVIACESMEFGRPMDSGGDHAA